MGMAGGVRGVGGKATPCRDVGLELVGQMVGFGCWKGKDPRPRPAPRFRAVITGCTEMPFTQMEGCGWGEPGGSEFSSGHVLSVLDFTGAGATDAQFWAEGLAQAGVRGISAELGRTQRNGQLALVCGPCRGWHLMLRLGRVAWRQCAARGQDLQVEEKRERAERLSPSSLRQRAPSRGQCGQGKRALQEGKGWGAQGSFPATQGEG